MGWNMNTGERNFVHPGGAYLSFKNDSPTESQKACQKHIAEWRSYVMREIKGKPAIERYRKLSNQLARAEAELGAGPTIIAQLNTQREKLINEAPDDLLAQLRSVDAAIAKAQGDETIDTAMKTLRDQAELARLDVVKAIADLSQRRGFELRQQLNHAQAKTIAAILTHNESQLNELGGVDMARVRLDDLATPVVTLAEILAAGSELPAGR
jgi:hypothetical protein